MTPAKRLATMVIDNGLWGHSPAMMDLARQILRKRPASPAKAWKPKRDKGAKRKAHAERTAEIRKAVFKRAREYCELCPAGQRALATELAHLEGGIGRRRQHQSAENTAASCHLCNAEWDSRPEWRLMLALRWSQRTGLPVPRGVNAAYVLKHPETKP